MNPNSYVASMGFWIVQKQIQSFSDELRFTFDLFPGNKLTAGGYLLLAPFAGCEFVCTAGPEDDEEEDD